MIKSIQLLRVLAALLVVNCHMGTLFLTNFFGSFGVDIFFIISGFIMTMLMETDSEDFMVKRLIRIFPVYFIFSLLQFIITILPGHVAYGPRSAFKYFLTSIFFINPNPVTFVGWSLNFEMFFYVMIWLFAFYRPSISIYLTCIVIIIGTAVRYLFNWHITSWLPVDYFSQDIMPEFVLGFLLFKIRKNIRMNVAAALTVIVCMIAAMIFFEQTETTHSRVIKGFLFFGIPSFCVCASFLCLEKKIHLTRFWKKILLIADSSYVMYLCHLMIIFFFDRILRIRLHIDMQSLQTAAKLAVYAGVMFTIISFSVLFHLTIEKRLTRFLRSVLQVNSRKGYRTGQKATGTQE